MAQRYDPLLESIHMDFSLAPRKCMSFYCLADVGTMGVCTVSARVSIMCMGIY